MRLVFVLDDLVRARARTMFADRLTVKHRAAMMGMRCALR
jgi:hypothetical protein